MRFLRLASNRFGWRLGDDFVYPYEMDLSVDGDHPMVAFAEGATHGSAGGAFSVAEALEPQWRRLIDGAGAEWLLPYLERLRSGGTVTKGELAADFEERHRRAPETYEWDIPGRTGRTPG